MKQIIEIEVPEGKKAIWKDNKVVFEDIAPKLPETWEEFCQFYPIKAEVFIDSNSQLIYRNCGISRQYSMDKNLLPSWEAAKAHLALIQLHQLRDCYRQSWLPDWNKYTYKYCIIFEKEIYNINAYIKTSHFLSFQSQELAEKFLKNFKDLIKQARDLI